MKRVSYSYLVYAVMSAMQSVFSDTDITIEQVLWFVKITVNKVKASTIKPGMSGSYLTTFTDVPTLMQYDGKDNVLRNKKYIEIPVNIFDFDLDQGIDWIAYAKTLKDENDKTIYCEPVYFQRSSLIKLREMSANPYEAPSAKNPYFVRVNNLLYLAGVEEIPAFKLDMAVFMTENPYIGGMSLDDEVLLDDEQINQVIGSVANLGKWLLSVPKSRIEEGIDDRNPTPSKDLETIPQQPQQQS